MSKDDSSPSHQRRQALRQADAGNTVRVLDSYPLSKYFDMSQRLLDAFQSAVDGRRLDKAYVLGLRFAAFGVESLPKHRDWRKSTNAKQKRRNAKQVDKVISMMEVIKQRMDVEEMVLQEQRRAREEEEQQQQETERQKKQEIEGQRKREEQREKAKQQKADEEKRSKNVEQSAMAKLWAMQNNISAPDSGKALGPKEEADNKVPDQGISKTKNAKASGVQSSSPEQEKVQDSASDMAKTGVSTPSETTNSLPRKSTPKSSREQKTINLLQNTIYLQEKRLEEIGNTQIPALVRSAKEYLNQEEADRDAALKCVARKRALERQMDVIKAAIFNMETQMFMLENAMEDQQVQKALNEASHAMKGLQDSVGDTEASTMDLTNMAESLSPTAVTTDEDDEELMEELQGWLEPGQKRAQEDTEEVSILSMPNVPAASLSDRAAIAADSSVEDDSSTIGSLMKAVLG